jgi:MFS transporter, DHA1 family, tetracycline resistance protein
MQQDPNTNQPKKQPSILPLAFTVFLDLLGFAMFIPDLQMRGVGLASDFLSLPADPLLRTSTQVLLLGFMVGFGQAVYSIAQLLTGTYLGRLSDIKGRRIVLLGSALLSVFAYVLYAHSDNVFLLYLSRALSGIAAANLGVAFAYIADISTPQERSGKLGLLGAAFGLGFVIGPALGAFLLQLFKDSPIALGYFAAGLCALNFVLTFIFVKEPDVERVDSGRMTLVASIKRALGIPGLGVILSMFFVMNLAFTNLETTFFRLLEAPNWHFQIPSDKVKVFGAIILTVVGVSGAFTQGFLVKRVVAKIGELKTVRVFYTAFIPVFTSIPYFGFYWPGLIGTVLLALTNGLSMPSMNGMVSKRAPRDMQGSIMGLTQSLGSLARVIGPLFSNALFQWRPDLPYLFGASLALIPLGLAWFKLKPENTEAQNAVA